LVYHRWREIHQVKGWFSLGTSETRIGIVGMGKMGLLHASILNTIPNAKVVAICEKKTPLVWYGKKLFPGVAVIDKVQGFSNLNLDAVVIATPIPSHFKIINKIYSIGISNIFVEKTLAANAEDSLKICELVQKAGGIHMVGYMARYAVTFRKAKELIDAGAIGKIIAFKGYAYSSDFVGIPEESAIRGGVIRDLGSHAIDLAFWCFGDLEVDLATLEPKLPTNGESSGNITVNCPNGLKGEFDISLCKNGYWIPDYGLKIEGVKGSIEVNNDSISTISGDQKDTWFRADLSDNVPFLVGAPEYYREDAAFINAILNKSQAEPDFFTASKVDCFIDQVKLKAAIGAKQ
jgi:predicted dehydrogenase